METILRVIFVYIFLMICLRIMGKREFGELAPFDLVVLLLIPEFFQQAVIREDFSITNSVVAVSTLLLLVFGTSLIAYRFRTLGKVVAGAPTTLAAEGFLIPENLDRERVSAEEIFEALHVSGLQEMSQVKWVILETDGRLSVIPWVKHGVVRPPTEPGPAAAH